MNQRPAGDASTDVPATFQGPEGRVGAASAAVVILALTLFLLSRGWSDQSATPFVELLTTHASGPTAVVAGVVHAGWRGGTAARRWHRILAWASAGLGVALLVGCVPFVTVLTLGFAYCLDESGGDVLVTAWTFFAVALAVAAAAAWWARSTQWPGARAAAWALSCAVGAPGLTVGLIGLLLMGSECPPAGN